MFQVAKEATSSSPLGLHYTIWKSMAMSDKLASFLCVMISLPFMYGFSCKRWKQMVDFMLEKKKGVWKIFTLRIISLEEADFNSYLKQKFARELMRQAEDNGVLSDEQWGLHNHRILTDVAL